MLNINAGMFGFSFGLKAKIFGLGLEAHGVGVGLELDT